MEHDTIDATIRRLVREEIEAFMIEASQQGRDSLLLDDKSPTRSQNRSGDPSKQDAARPGAAGFGQARLGSTAGQQSFVRRPL
jgi:hypothetical protein